MTPSIAVIGYASLDSSTSTPEFRGLDATSILERPLVASSPSAGGIAHIVRAVAATGVETDAVSWVGSDNYGRVWMAAIAEAGVGVEGVAVTGTRSPAATLIEVGTGGTICLFDPGDCQGRALTPEQIDLITSSDCVLVTVAPRAICAQVLEILPVQTRLVWAVKDDADAYPLPLAARMLERADVISFSRGERDWLSIDGVAPESRAKPGALVVETRGADGVAWAFASERGAMRSGSVGVDRVDVDDTTGAGDTFIGAIAGFAASARTISDLSDLDLVAIVTRASTAAGDVLRRRITSGSGAGAPQKETTYVD